MFKEKDLIFAMSSLEKKYVPTHQIDNHKKEKANSDFIFVGKPTFLKFSNITALESSSCLFPRKELSKGKRSDDAKEQVITLANKQINDNLKIKINFLEKTLKMITIIFP